MTHLRGWAALLLASGLCLVEARQGPSIRIESPSAKDAIRGDITIKMAVDGGGDPVSRIAVSVDGVPACTLTSAPFECRHNVGNEVRQRVIRAVGTFASGARASHTIVTRESGRSMFRSAIDAVLVNVSVRDWRGRFVAGLTKEQFRLYDNGAPQELTFFAPEGWACEVVLAVDVSGSMQKSLPAVRRAAAAFLAALRPEDRVTLVAFNSAFFVLAPPTASPEARLRAVDRLAPWDGTALFDALLASVDLLQSHDRRRAIVVFTDGEDRTSEVALERVEQRLAADDILLYVVGHGSASELPALRGTLDKVAQATGGRAVFLTDVDKAPEAFREIVKDLSQQYTLGFTPGAGTDGAGWRALRVEVLGGGYRVTARQGYVLQRPGG